MQAIGAGMIGIRIPCGRDWGSEFFRIRRRVGGFGMSWPCISSDLQQIPCCAEQGIFLAAKGFFSPDQGNFSTEQGIQGIPR